MMLTCHIGFKVLFDVCPRKTEISVGLPATAMASGFVGAKVIVEYFYD